MIYPVYSFMRNSRYHIIYELNELTEWGSIVIVLGILCGWTFTRKSTPFYVECFS